MCICCALHRANVYLNATTQQLVLVLESDWSSWYTVLQHWEVSLFVSLYLTVFVCSRQTVGLGFFSDSFCRGYASRWQQVTWIIIHWYVENHGFIHKPMCVTLWLILLWLRIGTILTGRRKELCMKYQPSSSNGHQSQLSANQNWVTITILLPWEQTSIQKKSHVNFLYHLYPLWKECMWEKYKRL